jgi:tetratricopeptide (TPR) repeat protein
MNYSNRLRKSTFLAIGALASLGVVLAFGGCERDPAKAQAPVPPEKSTAEAPSAGTQVERLLAAGRFREADQLVDQFAPGRPDSDGDFLRMAARAKLNVGNPTAAIAYAEKALAVFPRDSESKVVLGVALARTGQAARGEKLLTEMASRFSREVKFQCQLAEVRVLAGMLPEAERAARAAVALEPEAPNAHNSLGLVLMAQQRYPDAVDELKQAVMFDFSKTPSLQNNLSIALARAGKMDLAVSTAEAALKLAPDNASVLTNLGALFLQTKQWPKAVEVYEKSTRLNPTDGESWNGLGYALLQQKRYKDAIAPLEQAVQLKPNSRSAWANLANAARLDGNNARSKTADEKARSLPPDPPESLKPQR